MTTNFSDRQTVLGAVAEVGPRNMGAGNGVDISLPAGAVLLRLIVLTTTAFNSVTTATLTVSDGTTTFANAVDIKTTGSETVANVPKYYPTGGKLSVTLAQTGGDATAGAAVVIPEYVVTDRWSENQY